MTRDELLCHLSDVIAKIHRPHPARVAIDGVDGAGKTILGDDLAGLLEKRGREVIRASIDGFHRPRAVRYKRGADSPEGFYYDSFDHDKVRAELLEPLGPGGNCEYRSTAFDWRTDSSVDAPVREASHDAILLFDGIFSQRPELADAWDLRIFLDVKFEETLRRSLIRDRRPDQSDAELERRFWTRYAGGQRLYLADARPAQQADIVVDNNDPHNPRIIFQRDVP